MCPLGLGEDIGSLREEVIGANKVSDWELNSSPLHSYSPGYLSGPQLILQMSFPYGEMHDNPFLTRSKEGRTMSRMQENSFCWQGSPAQSRKSDVHKKDGGQIEAV